MTKKFKQFDTGFTFAQQRECREKWLYSGSSGIDRDSYDRWPEKQSAWPQDFVQFCVYQASDHEEWQLFRVSMKGLPTKSKLYMLHNRYVTLVSSVASDNPSGPEWTQYKIQKCRIDNYLGALVRGGQLNSNLEVVR